MSEYIFVTNIFKCSYIFVTLWSVHPLGAGLVNVHFPEFTFVLDITQPTIGEYVSVGGLGNEHFLEVTSVLAANN